MRSIFTGAKKCAGAKPHKGRKPDCGFAEAESPKGAKHIQSCYVKVAHLQLFFILIITTFLFNTILY